MDVGVFFMFIRKPLKFSPVHFSTQEGSDLQLKTALNHRRF